MYQTRTFEHRRYLDAPTSCDKAGCRPSKQEELAVDFLVHPLTRYLTHNGGGVKTRDLLRDRYPGWTNESISDEPRSDGSRNRCVYYAGSIITP